jgi:hypothetical protein
MSAFGIVLNLLRRMIVIVMFVLCWNGVCAFAQLKATDDAADAKPFGSETKTTDHIPERYDPLYEDWRKPALTPGMQSDVQFIDRQEKHGFIRELLHAQWRELDPIDLWVIRPTSVKKPPVVLYLYSYPATNDRYKDPKYCEFLTRNGVAAVGFVSALTEQRFHDRPTSDWFVSQLTESLGTTVHDVQMVLNYLALRKDMDMNRVGIWGDGSGAAIAIMAAAVDPRIKVLDLLNPWGDWSNWLAKSTLVPEKERETYLRPNFLKGLEQLEPINYLPALKDRQVRIQHIDNLTITPAIVREHIEAAVPANAKIVHYQSAKAFFTELGATGKGFAWVQDQLAPIRMETAKDSSSSTPGTAAAK